MYALSLNEVETYVISDLVIGPGTENFVKDLGSCLKRVSGDDEAYIQLIRRFSIAIQRRNCASVLGSIGILITDLFKIILLITPQCLLLFCHLLCI